MSSSSSLSFSICAFNKSDWLPPVLCAAPNFNEVLNQQFVLLYDLNEMIRKPV